MSTSTPQKMTWRERQSHKETQQKEAARKAAEETERKRYANTEENFPTLVTTAHRIYHIPKEGFATLANQMRVREETAAQMEAYRKAKSARERREILNTVVLHRRSNPVTLEEENETEEDDWEDNDLSEQFPQHGRRGRSTEPDEEGWRTVTKRMKKPKRELTEAELAQKYREEFFGEGGEEDEDMEPEDITRWRPGLSLY